MARAPELRLHGEPRRSLTRFAPVVVLAAVLVGAGCGGDDSSEPAAEAPRPENRQDSEPGAEQEPQTTTYRSQLYSVEIPVEWEQVADDEPLEGRIESRWELPGGATFLIDATQEDRTAAGKAEEVRADASASTDSYQETAFAPVGLGDLDAYEYGFVAGGEQKVDYLLSDCGTTFAVLGSAPADDFVRHEDDFRAVAASLEPDCDAGEIAAAQPPDATAGGTESATPEVAPGEQAPRAPGAETCGVIETGIGAFQLEARDGATCGEAEQVLRAFAEQGGEQAGPVAEAPGWYCQGGGSFDGDEYEYACTRQSGGAAVAYYFDD